MKNPKHFGWLVCLVLGCKGLCLGGNWEKGIYMSEQNAFKKGDNVDSVDENDDDGDNDDDDSDGDSDGDSDDGDQYDGDGTYKGVNEF